MNPVLFARIKEVLLTAATMPADERPGYLEHACGDDTALRAEVEGLLRQQGHTAGVIRTGALDEAMRGALRETLAASSETSPLSLLPERVGPYRIVGLLGEGGMGIVYRAEQQEPVRREVALKLVRGGPASAGLVSRFESERQTLAGLDHPNIATLLDAGSDPDRGPYFVMELVRGVPITQYCDAAGLGATQRIRLFLDVCRAVRHAHRRGIIHRDLKPSNILVTLVQDRPVTKVIDFSIAKAVEDARAEGEFRTRTGQVVGTLEYMSPEQARGATGEISTRSDVYALGVVLHELLTGQLPHDLKGLPLHEAVRRIVEEPPAASKHGGGTTAGRSMRLSADLGTILDKCLEKESLRRYESAADLAEDLELYLDSRPIRARPPGALYQFKKLVGRHRVAFGMITLLFAFLLTFAITVSVQLGIQRKERSRAEAQARRAEAEARKARHVVNYIQEVLLSALGDRAGKDVTIMEALEHAEGRVVKNLGEEPEGQAAVHEALGTIYRTLKEFDTAESHLMEALRLRRENLGETHPDTGWSYLELANMRFFQGRLEESEQLARDALAVFRVQEEPHPVLVADALNTLGLTLRSAGRLEEAVPVLAEALEVGRSNEHPTESELVDLATFSESLAGVYRRLGRYEESETLMREVVVSKRRFAGEIPDAGVSTALYNLAAVVELRGRYAEAESLYRETLEIESRVAGPDSPWTSITKATLASTLCLLGQYAEAEDLAHQAEEAHRSAGDEYNRWLADDLGVLGRVLSATGRHEEAEPAAREAVGLVRAAMGLRHPATAEAMASLGVVLAAAEQLEEAEAVLRESLELRSQVLPPAHPAAAGNRIELARVLLRAGSTDEVDELLLRARTDLEQSVGTQHPHYAELLRAEARHLQRQGRLGEALPRAREAVRILSASLGEGHPRLGEAMLDTATLLMASGQPAEAAAIAGEALNLWRNAEYADPGKVAMAEHLVGTVSAATGS